MAQITEEFASQAAVKPLKLRLLDDYDGGFRHVEYYPLCEDIYFDWLLCHATQVFNVTTQDLRRTTNVKQV